MGAQILAHGLGRAHVGNIELYHQVDQISQVNGLKRHRIQRTAHVHNYKVIVATGDLNDLFDRHRRHLCRKLGRGGGHQHMHPFADLGHASFKHGLIHPQVLLRQLGQIGFCAGVAQVNSCIAKAKAQVKHRYPFVLTC